MSSGNRCFCAPKIPIHHTDVYIEDDDDGYGLLPLPNCTNTTYHRTSERFSVPAPETGSVREFDFRSHSRRRRRLLVRQFRENESARAEGSEGGEFKICLSFCRRTTPPRMPTTTNVTFRDPEWNSDCMCRGHSQ